MNVLSLFDGISCGRIALERAGIPVEKYYASEVDKYAEKISEANYPDIIRLGDVTKWREWDIEQPDLICAGSPCQGFSFAGKQLNFSDPRSSLFFEFVNILNHYKTKYFFLENVKMKKEYQDIISQLVGCQPIEINSSLVSAQNRKRKYWTNIPGIDQPDNKGITLIDIIDYDADEPAHTLSENAMARMARKKYSKPRVMPQKTGTINTKNNSGQLSLDSGTTLIPVGIFQRGRGNNPGGIRAIDGKVPCLTSNSWEHNNFLVMGQKYRKLTPLECERLQTLPDNYTSAVSNSQRYHAIGNGWTVDVISWIFSFMNIDKNV
jgi:site-specific DNA-cytosine methylase